MTRTSWTLVASIGIVGLAMAPLACVDSSNSPPPPSQDSGLPIPPASDAAVPVTDAAAPPQGDAGAPAAASPPQALSLTVLLGGAPEPGVLVVFQDATGAVTGTATTGASGSVVQSVAAGSQVTIALGTADSPQLLTIQDVAPGDALTVVDPRIDPTALPVPDRVLVTLPQPTWEVSGVTEATYAGACNGSPSPLYFQSACASGGQFPLLAIAMDTNQQEIAYTYQNGNAEIPDGGVPDGGDVSVTITRPWSTSAALETITVSQGAQAPDSGTTGSGNIRLSYNEVAGNVMTASVESPNTPVDAGVRAGAFAIHGGYPDFVQAEAAESFNVGRGSGIGLVAAAARTAPPAGSQTTTFDLTTLPVITGASVDTTDAGTPLQPLVVWTSAASLAGADGVFVSFQWNTPPPDGGSYVNGTWTILTPPTAVSVRAPALPPSAAAWAPSPSAQFDLEPRVGAIQAPFLAGYRGLRAQFGGLPLVDRDGWSLRVPILPANGTFFLTAFFQNRG